MVDDGAGVLLSVFFELLLEASTRTAKQLARRVGEAMAEMGQWRVGQN
jgi:hypothetical protein